MVIGELACGDCGKIADRENMLKHLRALPSLPESRTEDVVDFIENRKLMQRGIRLVDVHLLHATERGNVKIWTSDKKLCSVATELGMHYAPNS